jgi:hypothetical protein
VCPNCGGGFVPRPIRPSTNWKGDNFLGKDPASTKVKHRPVDPRYTRSSRCLKGIPPHKGRFLERTVPDLDSMQRLLAPLPVSWE